MATYTDTYCRIHGYDFGSIIYAEGVEPSGGGAGVEEIAVPGNNFADLRGKGRAPKKYKIRARSIDREEIEAFLKEVNTAPEDAEFYPFEAGRSGRIGSAFASAKSRKMTGAGKNFYEADAEITCREAWLYGPARGIDFGWRKPLPAVSDLLTNAGQERAPITYLQASGDVYLGSYVENLSCRITPGTSDIEHDRELILCEKMMRGDIFELGWRGEVIHGWKTNFEKLWSEIGVSLQNQITGGIQAGQTLILDDGDSVMMPFHGPLPVSGEEGAVRVNLTVDAISGIGGNIYVSTVLDLGDMDVVDHDPLVVGQNTVYVPDMAGNDLVMIGVRAAPGLSNSLTLSSISGQVKRYVAPSKIPWADPGEDFKIRVESTAGTRAKFLQAAHNDRFWY
jgi:hypothetical protein